MDLEQVKLFVEQREIPWEKVPKRQRSLLSAVLAVSTSTQFSRKLRKAKISFIEARRMLFGPLGNVIIDAMHHSARGVELFCLDRVDGNGQSLLHKAVIQDKIEVIKYIISQAGNISRHCLLYNADSKGNTPVFCAKSARSLSAIVESAAENDENISDLLSQTDGNDKTVLHLASARRNHDIVQYLLSLNGSISHVIANIIDKFGNDAVHYADTDITTLFHQAGIYGNPPNDSNESETSSSTIEVLSNGSKLAETTREDDKRATSCRAPASRKQKKKSDVTQFIEKHGISVDQLNKLELHSLTKLIRAEPGKNVTNDADKKPYFPMIHCASSSKIAQLLINAVKERGDDVCKFVCKADRQGRTILHESVLGRKYTSEMAMDLIKIIDKRHLLSMMSIPDQNGATVLHYAKNEKVALYLLNIIPPKQRQSIVTAIDKQGNTTLHNVTSPKVVTCIFDSLKTPADKIALLKAVNSNGNTALHSTRKGAVVFALLRVAMKLDLDVSRYISTLNAHSQTVLHMASRQGNADIVKVVLRQLPRKSQQVLDILSIYDTQGNTALHYATGHPVASIIIAAVAEDQRESLIRMTNADGNTCLHTTKSLRPVVSITDAIPKASREGFIMIRNLAGRTALDTTSNAVKELLQKKLDKLRERRVLVDEQQGYNKNSRRNRAMSDTVRFIQEQGHNLDLIISSQKSALNLILHPDQRRATDNLPSFHCATTGLIAQLIHDAIISTSGDVNEFALRKDSRGQTVIHVAATSGRIDVIQYVLSVVNYSAKQELAMAKDRHGRTPIHCYHSEAVLPALVEAVKGPSLICKYISETDNDDNTVLHHASRLGYLDNLKYLQTKVEKKIFDKILQKRDKGGHTALHIARSGRITDFIIKSVAQWHRESFIRIRDVTGNTALHMAPNAGSVFAITSAIRESHIESFLLTKNHAGQTAYDAALNKEIYDSIVAILHQVLEGRLPPRLCDRRRPRKKPVSKEQVAQHTSIAAEFAEEEGVPWDQMTKAQRQTLCEIFAYPESYWQTDEESEKTASVPGPSLHCAGTHQIAKLLMSAVHSRGGDVDDFACKLDGKSRSILHHAADKDQVKLLDYLMTAVDGLPMNALWTMTDKDGNTALHLAKSSAMVKILMQWKGSSLVNYVCTRNSYGHTVIHTACKMGRKDVITRIAATIDPPLSEKLFSILDNNGNTAFYYAAPTLRSFLENKFMASIGDMN